MVNVRMMQTGRQYERPRWAPRLKRDEITRLYAMDAKGIVDEGLIDEVGYGLLARCESILAVAEAYGGKVQCVRCGATILSDHRRETAIQCPACEWCLPWSEFRKSTRRKCLDVGQIEVFLKEFITKFSAARGPNRKMVLIDTLIHRYHGELLGNPERPAANNLIGGKRPEVIAFLNRLSYGDQSTPGLKASHDARCRKQENSARGHEDANE